MLLPGSVNDQSWNAIGFAGLSKLKDQGFEIAYSENVSPADQIETMKDYASRGFSPVIVIRGASFRPVSASGPNFDKTWFIIASAAQGAGKNVAALDYKQHPHRLSDGCTCGAHVEERQDRRRVRARRLAERGCNMSAASVSAPRRPSPISR